MPALTFSKWSPGGNTTLFFPAEGKSAPEQARLARLALDPQHLGGEQAGFVDPREQRLRMAGGLRRAAGLQRTRARAPSGGSGGSARNAARRHSGTAL